MCDVNKDLLSASKRGNEDGVKSALEKKADVNCKDENGDTPLHIACRQRHTVIIRYLLSNGADITLMNKHNFTPLDEYVVVNYEDVLIKLSKKTEDDQPTFRIERSSPNLPENLLSKEPKKRHLMMLLDPLRYQWEIIAKELKVRPDEINCERFNKAHYETRRLSEILQDWIDQTENRKEVCWKTILFVVESRIKNEHVADNIRGFLSIKYVQDEYLSNKSDNVCEELKMLLPSCPIPDKELDKQLTTKDLIDLLHILSPIKYEWPLIGEQLEVDYDEIRSEEHNVAHDDLARLHDVLRYWINTTKFDKSWRTVITVIEEPPIQEKDIVNKIYEFLKAKMVSSDQEGSTSVAKPLLDVKGFPQIKELLRESLRTCKIKTLHPELKPKLYHLREQLHPIRYRWEVIGQELNVENGDIQSETFNVSNDDSINLSKVLVLWMNQRPKEVCWGKVLAVIKAWPIEDETLFEDICQFLSDIKNEYLSNGKKDISEDLKSKQPKFGHLMSLLEPLEDRWKEIGDALRIPTDIIQQNNDFFGNNYKLHEVFVWWGYYAPHTQLEFTWKTVIDVIKDPINDQVVSEAIHNFLTSDDVYSQYCP